jgi:serine/threonine-protein kinase
VDARLYSYGNTYDGSFSHTLASLARMNPRPVGSCPADESPYGVRDLSGGLETWCLNAVGEKYYDWRAMRGGAWSLPSDLSAAPSRHGERPGIFGWRMGLRAVIRPEP